jgi:hypothetical protein
MVERDEDARAAAVREVREESLIEDLHFDWGHASTLTGPYSRGKVAEYFVARTDTEAVTLPHNDELGRPSTASIGGSTTTRRCGSSRPRVRPVCNGGAGDEPAGRLIHGSSQNGRTRFARCNRTR